MSRAQRRTRRHTKRVPTNVPALSVADFYRELLTDPHNTITAPTWADYEARSQRG